MTSLWLLAVIVDSKMRKIRLSDTDLELFDIEISPSDFNFYQKHKDAFRTMWKEQVRYAPGDAGPEQS